MYNKIEFPRENKSFSILIWQNYYFVKSNKYVSSRHDRIWFKHLSVGLFLAALRQMLLVCFFNFNIDYRRPLKYDDANVRFFAPR